LNNWRKPTSCRIVWPCLFNEWLYYYVSSLMQYLNSDKRHYFY